MNKTLLVVCSIVALFVLGACNRGGDVAPENMPPGNTAPASAGASAVDASPVEATPQYTKGTSEHGFLVVDPGEVASCGGNAAMVATVRWNVEKPAADGLRVEVGNEGGLVRKLFSQGSNKGEAVTEQWVGEGTAFYLVDVATGEDIDSFVVGSKACGS